MWQRLRAYLGEPPPGLQHGPEAPATAVAFGGRIDRAWRAADDVAADPEQTISPVLGNNHAIKYQAWYAVGAATPCKTVLPGDVIVADMREAGSATGWVVVRRDKAGLVNLSLEMVGVDGLRTARDRTEIIARAIELRRRLG